MQHIKARVDQLSFGDYPKLRVKIFSSIPGKQITKPADILSKLKLF